MPRVGAVVRLALGAAALAMAGGLHAAGLFQPVRADVESVTKSTSLRRNADDAWERPVGIDRHELAAARDDVESAGAGRLLLNVRAGVHLDVVVERTAATRWGYSLSGRVVGERIGFVTLVVHEEAVAGSVWTPDSAYELSFLGDGIHALRDVTNALPFECGGALGSDQPTADATARQAGTDDGSVVDILMVWTKPQWHSGHSGKQGRLEIDMMVAYANDAFERSGAFVSLNLVGAEELDYDEFRDIYRLVYRLTTPDDGHLDHVHDLRDAIGADLVYLLSDDVPGGINRGAFGVGSWDRSTFAHEIGHAFGIDHERKDGRLGVRAYEHGFTTENCETTIMSYGEECIGRFRFDLPLYASPWRYSLRYGNALGVTRWSKKRGTHGPADAVLTLNRNRHYVANLRPSHNRD